jgi:hypothetical protein
MWIYMQTSNKKFKQCIKKYVPFCQNYKMFKFVYRSYSTYNISTILACCADYSLYAGIWRATSNSAGLVALTITYKCEERYNVILMGPPPAAVIHQRPTGIAYTTANNLHIIMIV